MSDGLEWSSAVYRTYSSLCSFMHVAKEHKEEDLRSVADLVGTNSTAALAFDDAIGGSKNFEGLSTRNQNRFWGLYRSFGEFFSVYIRSVLNAKNLPPHRPPHGM